MDDATAIFIVIILGFIIVDAIMFYLNRNYPSR